MKHCANMETVAVFVLLLYCKIIEGYDSVTLQTKQKNVKFKRRRKKMRNPHSVRSSVERKKETITGNFGLSRNKKNHILFSHT